MLSYRHDTKFPNMYFSSPKWNYEVLGGQYNTKADAALGIGEDIWLRRYLYQCQLNRE
ncbi:MAG: hypothetical protein ACLS9K_08675 [Lachnospira eligens]